MVIETGHLHLKEAQTNKNQQKCLFLIVLFAVVKDNSKSILLKRGDEKMKLKTRLPQQHVLKRKVRNGSLMNTECFVIILYNLHSSKSINLKTDKFIPSVGGGMIGLLNRCCKMLWHDTLKLHNSVT